MIVSRILLGLVIFFVAVGVGAAVNQPMISRIIGIGAIFVIISGLFMSENLAFLNPAQYRSLNHTIKRDLTSKKVYHWAPLFSTGISFEYPAYMKEKNNWGFIKQLFAPFVGIGTIWDHYWIVSTLFDQDYCSFFISVELDKSTLPFSQNYSGKPDYESLPFDNGSVKGTIQNYTDTIENEKVFISVLKFFVNGKLFYIKGHSLLEDIDFNKEVIHNIFLSIK